MSVERVSALRLGMASLGVSAPAEWEPNWIDYRSSVANVDRRRDRGEDVEICRECGCEVDVSPASHSPKCPTLASEPASNDHVEGLELLDRMDAGESVADSYTEPGEPEEIEEPGPSAETRAGAETAAAAASGTGEDELGGSSSTNDRARTAAWTPDEILDAIRRWAREYGRPPLSAEWGTRIDCYPTTSTVAKHHGSWANAVEAAGFERPTRGRSGNASVAPPAKRIRVRGTGLTYRTPEEAYVAADEIEADGQRVAEQARFDGNEAKAEQATDQSRALAERIRGAATAFEERSSLSGASSEVEKQEEAAAAAARLLITPDDMSGFQRALGLALMAGMRAAADVLEEELA